MTLRRLAVAAVIAAALCGGAARIGTAGWGLPCTFHPDEKGFVVWEGLFSEWRGLMHGDWRPRINSYGPLVLEGVVAMKWVLWGGPGRARAIAARYDSSWHYIEGAFGYGGGRPYSWPRLFLALRVLSGLLGTAAILLLAATAWRLEGRRAAVFAAVLAAACVGLIQVGHFYTAEAWLVFELALLLHACARLATGGRLGAAAYAGVALGLIAATKLPGLIVLPAVPVAIASGVPFADRAAWRARVRHAIEGTLRAVASRPFVVALAVGLVVFAIFNPWVFTQTHAYFHDLPDNRNALWLSRSMWRTDFGFYDWEFPYLGTTPFVYQLTHVLPYGLGVPLLLAALGGLAVGLWSLRPIDQLALVSTLPTFLLVGAWGTKTLRYLLPMFPGLVLVAAALLARWSVPADRNRGFAKWLPPVATWAVAAYTVAYGIAFTGMFAHPDPRLEAARWLAAHAGPGAVVVTDPDPSYTAPIGRNAAMVGPSVRPDLRVRWLWTGSPSQAEVPRQVRRKLAGARFVVIDDFFLRRVRSPQCRRRAHAQAAFYRALRSGRLPFRRVAVFRPEPRLGPLRWNERDAELLSVAFDHVGIEIYERVAPQPASRRWARPFSAHVARSVSNSERVNGR